MIVVGAIAVGILTNYFIAIALIPISIVFVFMRTYFIKTSRELKRIEAISKKVFI